MNIAHENYFYGVKELSNKERELIKKTTSEKMHGIQRIISEEWLNLFCAPYDLADRIAFNNCSLLNCNCSTDIKNSQEFTNWTVEFIERLHGRIESTGIQYILSLRENDLNFWKEEPARDEFSYFVSNQYLRTKKSRNAIIRAFEKAQAETTSFKDIRPERMWIPLALILATNLGAYIAQNFKAVILQIPCENSLIVGDQPVVNTYSTFDMNTEPDDIELFYPITTNSALLLTKNPDYVEGQIIRIDANRTHEFNKLERMASEELVFASQRSQLFEFVD